MAFFQLVLKARNLRQIRENYHDEKLRSIEISRGRKVHLSLGQKIRRQKILLKRKLRSCIGKCVACPKNTWLYKKSLMLRTDGTLENFILKSVFGFFGGVLLTYVLFVFFVFQLHLSLFASTLVCAVLGAVLSIGMAFVPAVRCVVFLFLPQFFSKRGRQALMAYAFILTLTGPVKNTFHNLAILTESLSCCHEQLKEAVQAVIDMMKQPFYALKDTLSSIVKSIKAIVRRIKKTLLAIKRIVIGILNVIKSVFDWLGSIVGFCNQKFGSPFDRCNKVFDDAVLECEGKLGPFFGGICNVAYVTGKVCYVLKPLDVICVLVSHVSDAVVGTIRKKIQKFIRKMKEMFYVKIKFSHSFHMETNKSRSIGEISSDISKAIKSRTNRVLLFFDWFTFMTTFFFIFLVLRVLYYRYKWLSNDRFDNRYVSGYMREIDLRRAKLDKETIFPLNSRERRKYVALSSILLARTEKTRLAKSAVFLALTTVKLVIYMAIDYCFFWLLNSISYYGRVESKVERPRYSSAVEVKGQGFIADIYRSIVRAFSPYNHIPEIDEVPCLPNPLPPNYDNYVQILTLALFCWIMAFFEPYGLRLRHVVLNSYYPDRAQQRAVWLYNHIIRSRGSFLKFARRQLRRKFGTAYAEGIERVGLRERLWAVCPLLNRLAPLKLKNACLVCGAPDSSSTAPHVRCPTPGCAGVFCPQCFVDLRKLCTVCMSPLDYGDLSDISEERDSSEEEIDINKLHQEQMKNKTEVTDEDSEDKEKFSSEQEETSNDDSSKYSYSYQDELTSDSIIPQKTPFKDVEAQEIRDDVTMEIFKDLISDELLSSSEKQIVCFGKRKKSSKFQTQQITRVDDKMDSDASSIANTESWTTEEVGAKEDTSVFNIDVEDLSDQSHGSDKVLIEKSEMKKKSKKKKFKGFLKAITKLFKKKKEKQSKLVQANYYKDSIQAGERSEESSSSSISSTSCESHALLILPKAKSSSETEKSILRKRSIKIANNSKDVCVDQFSKRSKISQKQNDLDNQAQCPAYLTRFKTKELPRHLKSICSNTKYFEVDENSSYNSPREKIEYRNACSTCSDSRSSIDSDPSRDRRSSTPCEHDSYIYTSENNDERYKTRSQTSNSSIPDDVLFSEMSTDNSDNRGMSYISVKNICNEQKGLAEKDKINDDSDEKSRNRRIQKLEKFKYRKPRFSYPLYNIKNKQEDILSIESKEGKEKRAEATEKSAKLDPTKLDQTKKSDNVKHDKVEKETANAKKKNLSIEKKPDNVLNDNLKKVNKSIGVNEEDIDNNLKQTEKKTDRSADLSVMGPITEHYQQQTQRQGHQQQFMYGFQPIISDRSQHARNSSQQIPGSNMHIRTNVATATDETNRIETSEGIQDSTETSTQPQTKDQGTYVRLKTKRRSSME